MSLVLAFYKGRRAENRDAQLFDRLICWWHRSRGRFSHCELVASDSPRGWALCWSSSPRDGGMRGTWINLASGHWVLVTLPHHDGETALQWMRTREGRKYDWLGVLGYVLPFVKQKRGRLYCSEACAHAVHYAARMHGDPALPLEWPDSNISPSALFAWASAQPGARAIDPTTTGE